MGQLHAGDNKLYATGEGDHGLASKEDEPDEKNLKNGWQEVFSNAYAALLYFFKKAKAAAVAGAFHFLAWLCFFVVVFCSFCGLGFWSYLFCGDATVALFHVFTSASS